MKCWGLNGDGQLGLGDTNIRGDETGEMGSDLPAIALGTDRTSTKTAGGRFSTCTLLDNGALKCWGENYYGQLGLGDTENRGNEANEMGDNLSTVDLGSGPSVTQLAGGAEHVCALLDDGSIKCWGRNGSGQLGLGDTNLRGDEAGEMGDNLPTVDLGSGYSATQITAGHDHTCALLDDGSVKCWGYNSYGQLGLGDTNLRGDDTGEMGDNLPTVNLGSGHSATQVTAGYNHTCALLDDGSVKCWGGNSNGQLGLGDANSRGDDGGEMGDNLSTVDLGTGRTASDIATGDYFTCARLDDASVKCWGENDYGQLGLGDTNHRGDETGEMGDNLPAVDLGSGVSATQFSAGAYHVCALLDDGSLKCWGRNDLGMLGLEDTNNRGDEANEMGDNLPAVQLDGQTLPVELADFTVRRDADRALLSWQTTSETNNAGFEIRRLTGPSGTGQFESLGFVEGAGTTSTPQSYRFHTGALSPGTHRFQLKQVDTDGSASLSEAVSVEVPLSSRYQLIAPTPNPTAGPATLRLSVKQPQSVRVTVHDLLGRTVGVAYEGALSDQSEHTISLGEALSAGSYLVRVQGQHFATTTRLTVVE